MALRARTLPRPFWSVLVLFLPLPLITLAAGQEWGLPRRFSSSFGLKHMSPGKRWFVIARPATDTRGRYVLDPAC
jgi:hypothetical protein